MQNTLHKVLEADWWFLTMDECGQATLVNRTHSTEGAVNASDIELEDCSRRIMEKAVPFSIDRKTVDRLEPILPDAKVTAAELWAAGRLRLPYENCFFTVEAPVGRWEMLVQQSFEEDNICGDFKVVCFYTDSGQLTANDRLVYLVGFERPKDQYSLDPLLCQYKYSVSSSHALKMLERDKPLKFGAAVFDTLMVILGLLHTRGVATDRVEADAPLNKSRVRRGKTTIRDTIQIKINQPYKTGSKLNGVRKAPRVHWRRGHLWGRNTRPVEQQHWRSPTLVGLGQDCDPLMDGNPPVPTYQVAA